uniref:2-hydroxyacyl-CoA lyase 2 n=1 Tax=Gongylonema pulchrum TaxID=637853 RepID=A0A183E321_9BILA
LVAAENLGIRVLDTRHEATAVFAADAVARLRRGFGVAVVTAGPGAAPTLLQKRGALQDIDQITLMRPLCKYVARITRVKEIIPILKEAICVAQSGTPGPVFVEMPVDVLYPYGLVIKEVGVFKDATSLAHKARNLYLMAHICRQFGGNWFAQELTPRIVTVPLPNDSDIQKATDLLLKAKKPVMIMGSQAVLPPTDLYDLVSAVKHIGIPVYLGGMSRGLLGVDCTIQMHYCRKENLKEADLIILAGTVCDFRLSYGHDLSRHAAVVAVNRSSSQLFRNEGQFWRVTLAIQADVATTLVHISRRLYYTEKQHALIAQWVNDLKKKDEAKIAENVGKMRNKYIGDRINPLRLLSLINEVLPKDALLIADGGDFVASAAYIVRPRGPLQWLDPGAFGTLGVGAGFALGARVVHPNRPVVILFGDGACGFSFMDLDTFVRHKLGVLVFIGNDACWSQIARGQLAMFNSSVAVNLLDTRYDNVAAALGAAGKLISPENGLTRVQFEELFASAALGETVVANVLIGKTDFRAGSMSV